MEMEDMIDTTVVTDTAYDVHDADMFYIASRDEYALVYAVDDHSVGDDLEFRITTYYCNDNGDVYEADTEIDDWSVGITVEQRTRDLDWMATHELMNCEAHYGAEFTMSPVRR